MKVDVLVVVVAVMCVLFGSLVPYAPVEAASPALVTVVQSAVVGQGEVTREQYPVEMKFMDDCRRDAEFLRDMRNLLESRLARYEPLRAVFEANPGVVFNDGRNDPGKLEGVSVMTAQRVIDQMAVEQDVYDILNVPSTIVTIEYPTVGSPWVAVPR